MTLWDDPIPVIVIGILSVVFMYLLKKLVDRRIENEEKQAR